MHQFVFKKKARQLSGLYMVSENLKNHLKTRNQPKTKVVNPIMFCLEWPIYLVLVKKKNRNRFHLSQNLSPFQKFYRSSDRNVLIPF